MDLIPYKTPKVLKQFFSSYVWDLYQKNEKKLYLTFDDGPIPGVTEFVLEQLKQHKAKATFFCIGSNIKKHPDIFKKIIAENHAIGNHTTRHLKAWKIDSKTYINDINDCQAIIQEFYDTKSTKKLFRPPYGQISYSKFKILEEQGYKIILWDVLSKDWEKNTTSKICLENIIQNTKKGSIIVFHDSIKASEKLKFVLPKVLEHFAKKGFIFDKIEF